MNWLHEGRLPALSEVWRFGCYKRKNSSMSSLAYHVFLLQCRFALFLRTYYKCELHPFVPRCATMMLWIVSKQSETCCWTLCCKNMKFHQRNRSASTIRFVLMISGRVLRVLLCCTVWEMWEVFGNSCPSSLPLFFSLLLLGFHFSPSQVQVVEVVLNMIQSILVSLTLFIQHRYMIWSCRINTKGYLRMLQLCNPILHLCFSGQFTYTHPQNSLKTNLASLQSCAVS